MVAGKSKQDTQFSYHGATKVAVAQICRSSGFIRCQPSALDALTRISSLYILSLSRSASSSASLSGRTHSNLLDFLSALHDLSSPFGFPGASLPFRCLLKSPTFTGLRSFVRARPQLPFAQPIRRGDPRPHPDPDPGEISSGRRMEIPPWLPDFPALGEANEAPKRSELYWEEMRPEFQSESELLKRVDKRRKMLPLERDRVKFRVWGKDKSKTATKLMLVFSSQEVKPHCNYHQD